MTRNKKFVLTINGANGVKYYVTKLDRKKPGENLSFGSVSDALVMEDVFETDQLLAEIKKRIPSADKELVI